MTYTIETIHKKITNKFLLLIDSTEKLSEIYPKYKSLLNSQNLFINIIANEIHSISHNYNISVVSILNDYYLGDNIYTEKYNTSKYYSIIIRENYISKLEELSKKICDIINIIISESDNNTSYQLAKMKNEIINSDLVDIDSGMKFKSVYDECTCEYGESYDPIDSRCGICGKINEREKFITEDIIRETKKKSNGYDPDRHFDDWMSNIQADNNFDFSKSQWKKIDEIIQRDNPSLIYIEEAREILKELKLTKYNCHAPLIMKKRGGMIPPRLDPQIEKRVCNMFDYIIRLLDRIMEEEGKKGNRPYYPHFMYFIFDIEAQRAKEEGRKEDYQTIVKLQKHYIYLQSDDTIIKNDNKLRKICELDEKLAEEEYKTTGIKRIPLKFRATIRKIKN